MRLIDTNIIMYALGKPHPLRDPCRELLNKVAREEVEANVDTEVIQELLYVYSSRGEREKGLKVVKEMLVLFPTPFPIRWEEVAQAKELMKKYKALVARDAIHCATALTCGLEGIFSLDSDLERVREVTVFKP